MRRQRAAEIRSEPRLLASRGLQPARSFRSQRGRDSRTTTPIDAEPARYTQQRGKETEGMKTKTLKKSVLSLLAGGGAAMGTTYEWTGGGGQGHYNWDNYQNWDCGALCDPTSYPSTTNDDAIIEWNSMIDESEIHVLTNETIDDLTIANGGSEGGPIFKGDGESTTTITCDTVTIGGANSARTIVKATYLARTKTN